MAMSDDFTVPSRTTTYEPAAVTALVAGIVGVLLLWPLGVMLGPLAFWSGISARRRIETAGGRLVGSRLAVAGIVIGSTVCVLSALILLAEVVVFISTGGFIPAY
jgi:uncharacterized Tic20 family protein